MTGPPFASPGRESNTEFCWTETESLESIAPDEALEWYHEHRSDELRSATQRKHSTALGKFIEWTDEADIDDLSDLRGRDLMAFKTWRKRESDLNRLSLNGTLAILRRFLVFCARIEAVEPAMIDRVPLPNVPEYAEVSTDTPTDEEIEAIREYYRKFDYASRRQAMFELFVEVGLRLGALRSIDLEDIDTDAGVIQLVHRPEGDEEYGTPLKNGPSGERRVNLSPRLSDVLADYIEMRRVDTEDCFGRKPLFTTSKGRISTTTIRRNCYKMTRPCEYTNECPHDREISECDAINKPNAEKCPSSYSTHPLRRWSIMHQLAEGVRKELLSDRVDVSVPVLEKHYDQRTEERKSEQRRAILAEKLPEFGEDG